MIVRHLLATVPVVILVVLPHASATTITNCSGTKIRIVTHDRGTAPSETGVWLRNGMGQKVSYAGAQIVKVFEVRLFDVLRLSVADLDVNATYAVMIGIDGQWILKRADRC